MKQVSDRQDEIKHRWGRINPETFMSLLPLGYFSPTKVRLLSSYKSYYTLGLVIK
jgi:hypothetical protein